MQSALAALTNQAAAVLNEDRVPGRSGNRHPSITPYETFAAADGELVIACGNDAIFRSLCAAVGAPALAADERFATNDARAAHRGALEAELRPAAGGAHRGRLGAGPAGRAGSRRAGQRHRRGASRSPRSSAWRPSTTPAAPRPSGRPTAGAPPRPPSAVRRPRLGEHDGEIRAWLAGAG